MNDFIDGHKVQMHFGLCFAVHSSITVNSQFREHVIVFNWLLREHVLSIYQICIAPLRGNYSQSLSLTGYSDLQSTTEKARQWYVWKKSGKCLNTKQHVIIAKSDLSLKLFLPKFVTSLKHISLKLLTSEQLFKINE